VIPRLKVFYKDHFKRHGYSFIVAD